MGFKLIFMFLCQLIAMNIFEIEFNWFYHIWNEWLEKNHYLNKKNSFFPLSIAFSIIPSLPYGDLKSVYLDYCFATNLNNQELMLIHFVTIQIISNSIILHTSVSAIIKGHFQKFFMRHSDIIIGLDYRSKFFCIV